MSKNTVLCDLCPKNQRLNADFVITQYDKKRVLDKACSTCVTRELEKGKVTFTLLDSLQFFQGLALDTRSPRDVQLEIRRGPGGKILCSRPDCDGETHGKSVTVYDIVYEICSCDSVAAFVAASKWGGPWPQGAEKAVEARVENNGALKVSLLERIGIRAKPAPQPTKPADSKPASPADKPATPPPAADAKPEVVEMKPAQRQHRPNGKRARKAKANTPEARANEPSGADLRDQALVESVDAIVAATPGLGNKPAETESAQPAA